MTHERNPDNPSNSTPKDEQRTPPSLFKKLDDRFDFFLDSACTRSNCLCTRGIFHDEGKDALNEDWTKLSDGNAIFNNPPYSKGKVEAFLSKGYEESLKGTTVVFLIPCDPSTQWFDWCMFAAEWIRIKGRVQFCDENGIPIKGSPSFSSIVVVFDEKRRHETGHLIVSEMDWK